MNNPQDIVIISPVAQNHIYKKVQEQNAYGFLFGVENGGCSGKQYVQGFVEKEPELQHFQMQNYTNGLKVLIPNQCVDDVMGVQLDLAHEGVNTRLVIINPNASGGCGCGKSFQRREETKE